MAFVTETTAFVSLKIASRKEARAVVSLHGVISSLRQGIASVAMTPVYVTQPSP